MPKKLSGAPYLFLSTAPTTKEASLLSRKLISGKLAACVNVIYPATSFFKWKGKAEKAREAVLVIKTTSGKISALKKFFEKYHSYENPELVGWKIEQGSASYLDWVKMSVC